MRSSDEVVLDRRVQAVRPATIFASIRPALLVLLVITLNGDRLISSLFIGCPVIIRLRCRSSSHICIIVILLQRMGLQLNAGTGPRTTHILVLSASLFRRLAEVNLLSTRSGSGDDVVLI